MTVLAHILAGAVAGALSGFAGAGIRVVLRRWRRRRCSCGHPRQRHGLYRDVECAMCGCRRFAVTPEQAPRR